MIDHCSLYIPSQIFEYANELSKDTDLYFISQIKAPPPLSVCSTYQFLVINMKCPKLRELILEIKIGVCDCVKEREVGYENELQERQEYLRCENPNGDGKGKLRSESQRETRSLQVKELCGVHKEREREREREREGELEKVGCVD
jgi:hypothetical protein